MSIVSWAGRRRGAALAVAGVALVAVGAGSAVALARSGDGGTDGDGIARQPPSVASLSLPGVPATAQSDPVPDVIAPQSAAVDPTTAVTSYLTARRDGALEAAYALLSPASRSTFPTPAAWRNASVDLPRPVAFTVTGSTAAGAAAEVSTDVSRTAVLDTFAGFVAEQTTEVYRSVQTPEGWRVDAVPVRATPTLLPDEAAQPAVTEWLAAVAGCDGGRAVALQTSESLLGDDTLPGTLCTERAALSAGPAEAVSGGPDTAAFLAAFGPEIGIWARIVPVTGPGHELLVAVAPLGASWRVFGIVNGTTS